MKTPLNDISIPHALLYVEVSVKMHLCQQSSYLRKWHSLSLRNLVVKMRSRYSSVLHCVADCESRDLIYGAVWSNRFPLPICALSTCVILCQCFQIHLKNWFPCIPCYYYLNITWLPKIERTWYFCILVLRSPPFPNKDVLTSIIANDNSMVMLTLSTTVKTSLSGIWKHCIWALLRGLNAFKSAGRVVYMDSTWNKVLLLQFASVEARVSLFLG